MGDLRFKESLEYYEKISTGRIPFFREDHGFSSALMSKIILIQSVQETQPTLLDELEIHVDIPQSSILKMCSIKTILLEQRYRKLMTMALFDSSQVVALLLDIHVQDVEVGKNVLDKSLDKSGEYLESATKLYGRWFSKKQKEQASDKPTIKTEPRIFFSMRELKTSNACYAVNGMTLEKLPTCTF